MQHPIPRQPFLHDAAIALRAPAQAWSRPDGTIGSPEPVQDRAAILASPHDIPRRTGDRAATTAEPPTAPVVIDGLYLGDTRVLDGWRLRIAGAPGEHIATAQHAATELRVVRLHRELDGPGADPDVRSELTRTVRADGVDETLVIRSRRDRELRVPVELRLHADLSPMSAVKEGRRGDAPARVELADGTRADAGAGVASWGRDGLTARLRAADADVRLDADDPAAILLGWEVVVPPRGEVALSWSLDLHDERAVVDASPHPTPWSAPGGDGSDADSTAPISDDRVHRWLDRALADLDALRLVRRGSDAEFLAAGAPWFLTMFGRDALWAARLLLPLDGGVAIAASTVRALAELQGRERVAETAEQPGKIMHELRSATLSLPTENLELPPLYYGTVDATPLWICLLHDAWRAGLPEAEVRALLPQLRAALAWMRDFGDSDGDGLLEYVDQSGRGLANQGWKDSGDSVQWRDGRLAEGPIALVEVQGYAYEAATHGADLLEALGAAPGAGRTGLDAGADATDAGATDAAAALADEVASWRAWAERLRAASRAFWVGAAAGAASAPYPAIALDAHKRPVDSLTSNIGHLLGTGLLDTAQVDHVARAVTSPALDSGYGLRTMSSDDAGFWPLSYHGGSVWAHDTAVVIRGLLLEGRRAEARQLAEGLLAAAAGFGYRMPELHGGDPAADIPSPVPYPAACRPQSWSAAAAVTVWSALRA
ncbi:amylo-alpha-1,6-glucosidase [Schumannella soli]|uniref:Amylo-alpha-1,6-glucosidase n=2 Tax=Schumannella soli TaxID=2590779 RepID=A0A506YAJ7_9MICO|nr:amylo-alpha-1,6-glucosidase [Schumannella soli]